MNHTGRLSRRQERVEVDMKSGRLSFREAAFDRVINLGWGFVLIFGGAAVLHAVTKFAETIR